MQPYTTSGKTVQKTLSWDTVASKRRLTLTTQVRSPSPIYRGRRIRSQASKAAPKGFSNRIAATANPYTMTRQERRLCIPPPLMSHQKTPQVLGRDSGREKKHLDPKWRPVLVAPIYNYYNPSSYPHPPATYPLPASASSSLSAVARLTVSITSHSTRPILPMQQGANEIC